MKSLSLLEKRLSSLALFQSLVSFDIVMCCVVVLCHVRCASYREVVVDTRPQRITQ